MNEKWQKLVGATIIMNNRAEESECLPDKGMMAKVVKVISLHDDVVNVVCDFSAFMGINKLLAKANFFDGNGEPRLTWFELKTYPKDGCEDLFMEDSDIETGKMLFDVVETGEVFPVLLTKSELGALLDSSGGGVKDATHPKKTAMGKLREAIKKAT